MMAPSAPNHLRPLLFLPFALFSILTIGLTAGPPRQGGTLTPERRH